MSIASGPSTIEDGLVFCYDMGNTQKSWKGKPTTNLVAAPYDLLTGFGKAAGVTVTNNVAQNVDGTLNVGLVTGNGWLAYTGAIPTTNGQQYTTSWVVRKDAESINVSFGWGGAHQGNLTTFTFNLQSGAFTGVTQAAGEVYGVRSTGNFWVVYYSSTLTSGNAYYPQITIGTGVNVYFGGIQIESGNISSPIVTGTRSNTQALIDLTSKTTITALSPTYNNNDTFSFNGGTERIDLGATIGPMGNNWTISAWINSTNISLTQNILSMNGPYFMRLDGSKVRFNVLTDTWLFQPGTTTLSSNTWYFLTMVWNGSANTWTGYINNTQEFSVSKSGAMNAAYSNFYGYVGYTPQGGEQSNFYGQIPVVYYYNRALTSSEIEQNFNALRGRYGV